MRDSSSSIIHRDLGWLIRAQGWCSWSAYQNNEDFIVVKVILISMPDVVPIIIHETAVHMPNHGIASVGGNIDEEHDVYLIDLIRKRR